MTKYKVNMARTTWLTAYVEADDEEQAIEAAHEEVPALTAHEAGWGSFGKWAADADEWQPVDEFYAPYGGYDRKEHGPVVELDERDK
ncbi:hypothetical protein ACTMTF_15360 [Nonomuraea sp. ZG12]|uniref:hypothetical protein n=1 Tax=Nonomuraea sp. ZG12 TaxID=3452207 RepID=UPI003F8A20FA